jgi:hypothetical protein
VYSGRSSEYEQLLIRPFLRKTKNTNMAGDWMFKYIFYFMDRTHGLALARMKCCTLKDYGHMYKFYLNDYFVWRRFCIWRCFRHFEVMLGQTVDCFVYNSVILCSVISLWAIYPVIVKCDITDVSWYDNDIILKPQFNFMLYLSNVFWILEIATRRLKILDII